MPIPLACALRARRHWYVSFGPRLADGNVVLRPPVESDIDARAALGFHEDIQRGFGAVVPGHRSDAS